MPAEIAAGSFVSPGAVLGDGVVVMAGAVIRDGVILGDGVVVEECAVLGKRPRLRAGSSAATGSALGPLQIGAGTTVCCGAVVYAGASVGEGVIIGDQAQVRERSVVGSRSVVGRGSSVDFGARVGERVLIQTGVYVTAGTIVEDDVFLGPGVTTTNDSAMGRLAPGTELVGPTFRRACRVGGGVVVVPGIEIGEEAFIAAGAVVTRDVPARGFVMGVPGRVVRQVADSELLEHWR